MRAHVLGLGAAYAALSLLSGCVHVIDARHVSDAYVADKGLGATRVVVHNLLEYEPDVREAYQAAAIAAVAALPDTRVISDAEAPVDSTVIVTLGLIEGSLWMIFLPPVPRAASKIQYSIAVVQDEEKMAEVLRTRTWRRYFALYGKEQLRRDFQEDLHVVLKSLAPNPKKVRDKS